MSTAPLTPSPAQFARAYEPFIIDTGNGDAVMQLKNKLLRTAYAPQDIIAYDESVRLTNYFQALERRLSNESITHHIIGAPAKTYKDSFTALFNQVAQDSNNIVLSEFSIIPTELMNHPEITALMKQGQLDTYLPDKSMGQFPITMGFLQISNPDERCSTSIPVLSLPQKLCDLLSPVDAKPLLEHLRLILTDSNHDMLHHLTNSYLNQRISKTGTPPPYAKPMIDYFRRNTEPGDTNPKGYEGWAVMSHILTWRERTKTGDDASLQDHVNGFYQALRNVDTALENTGMAQNKRRDITHYFSMLCQFSLMRFQALNSPIMQSAIEQGRTLDHGELGHIAALLGNKKYVRASEDPSLCGQLLAALHDIAAEPSDFAIAHAAPLKNILGYYNQRIEWVGENGINIDELDKNSITKTAKPKYSPRRFGDILRGLIDAVYQTPHTDLTDTDVTKWAAIKKPLALHCVHLPVIDAPGDPERSLYTAEMAHAVATETLLHIVNTPSLRVKYATLLTACCAYEIDILRRNVDNADKYWEKLDIQHPTNLIKTLKNYRDDGSDILTMKTADAAQLIRLIRLGPDIAFLASPPDHNQELKSIGRNTYGIDMNIRRLIVQNTAPTPEN